MQRNRVCHTQICTMIRLEKRFVNSSCTKWACTCVYINAGSRFYLQPKCNVWKLAICQKILILRWMFYFQMKSFSFTVLSVELYCISYVKCHLVATDFEIGGTDIMQPLISTIIWHNSYVLLNHSIFTVYGIIPY